MTRDRVVTAALSFCLIANLAPIMTFPAMAPEVSQAWGYSVTEIGWIGGVYFAGYAAAVPLLAGATDRFDCRWIIIGSSLMGAIAGLAFAMLAGSFWPALVFRCLGGVALAGVHMPGLKFITERIGGPSQTRSVAIYTSSYAFGSAGSFLLAGLVAVLLGWRAAFFVAGISPLLAVVAMIWLPPSRPRPLPVGPTLAFGGVVRNRAFMAYVLGFAGNTWEVFGIRVWFVACLSWSLSLPGNHLDLPNLAVIGGLASLAGVPVSIFVAELASKWNRSRVIVATCLVSVAVCLTLAATAGGGIVVFLALLILLQITSFADVGALSAGAVVLSDPARRGAALAIYAFAGFTTGFLGPVVIGFAIDWFGGLESRSGWTAAFLVMALGSMVAGLAVWSVRHNDQGAR
ncbi:MAG: MFS transporter [Rhodospirillaceae bacterium]|jgi:MFS family permease|nr:MFS transporter [Rhodospirillaceae bacterium]MBT5666573.1 MFS transporter [Rhodospirillaceae bacterium]MBT5811460.1 MFS transporter [Rhodospirillaceae bacterium]